MAKRKRRDNEITCMCTAYDHPHRLGGGACTGAGWCQAYRGIDSYMCGSCNYQNYDGSCDVTTGLEPISLQCECVADECRTRHIEEDYGCLPLDIENYWIKLETDYYENS